MTTMKDMPFDLDKLAEEYRFKPPILRFPPPDFPTLQEQIERSKKAKSWSSNLFTYTGGFYPSIASYKYTGHLLVDDTEPEPPKPKPETIEETEGSIIGYRAWAVRPDGRLRSIAHDTIWASSVVQSLDEDGESVKPSINNDYGIYAMNSFIDALLQLGGEMYGSWITSNFYALGQVEMWGRTVKCTKGYRAENASIYSFYKPLFGTDSSDELIELVSAMYPAVEWIDLEAKLT